MGDDRLEFGVKIRRNLVISVRSFYKSAWNHPFLVVMVCFLMLLYRLFPFAFAFLVSSSPILVCTAILLGTLLSFGQPNIPEIEEEEEKVTHESSSLKTGRGNDTTVVERDGSFTVERYTRGKRRSVLEDSEDEDTLMDSQASEAEEGSDSNEYAPLYDKSSKEIQREKQVVEISRGYESETEKKRELFVEKPVIEGVSNDNNVVENGKLGDENHEGEEDVGTSVEASDSEKEEDHMVVSPISPWRPRRLDDEDDEGDDDGEESLDSGSDGAESSSPDASLADIIPMLDELHPLLDLEGPQHSHHSHDESVNSTDEGDESDVDTEEDNIEEGTDYGDDDDDDDNDEDYEVDVDEEDDDDEEDEGESEELEHEDHEEEEEEEAQVDIEDGSKSAIKWTEDDQKNLMDLGSLELERNQRLENLIARRKARQSLRLLAEKNLIDLDFADIPANIPAITTTRRNPFDLPYDSYDELGLPPIPGSAPSMLRPRKNPFDLPYDPTEEKLDLKEDSFQQEFSASNKKEPTFRRHESFHVGTSTLGGGPRQDKLNGKFRPYFAPERLGTEGWSYPSLERQLSEMSESKASSVPDTESVSSVVEEDKLNEQDAAVNTEMSIADNNASANDEHESQSPLEVDSVDIEQAEKKDTRQNVAEITLGDVESHHELDINMEAVVESSTREMDSKGDAVEEDFGGLSASSGVEEKLSEAVEEATLVESNAPEMDSKGEAVEEDFGGMSSLPASSEVEEEKVPEARKEDESSSLEPESKPAEESSVSPQHSAEMSMFNIVSRMVDEHQNEEPVFDASPPSMEKFYSFNKVRSGISISDTGSPSEMLDSLDEEFEVPSESLEDDTSDFENEDELDSKEIMEISEHDVSQDTLSRSDPSYDHDGSMVLDELHQDSTWLKTSATEEQPPSVIDDHFSAPIAISSFSETEDGDKHEMNMEGHVEQLWDQPMISEDGPAAEGMTQSQNQPDVQSELDEAIAPSSNSDINNDGDRAVGEGLSSMPSIGNEQSRPEAEQDQPQSSVVEQLIYENSEQEQSAIAKESAKGVNFVGNAEDIITANALGLTADFTSLPSETPECGSPTFDGIQYEDHTHVSEHLDSYGSGGAQDHINEEEADEIKDIDEDFLAELDTVGDFSVNAISESELHQKEPIHMEQLPSLEVRSLEDIESALKQIHEGAEVEEVILPSTINDSELSSPNEPIHMERLPSLEVRSLQDIESALKQIHEGAEVDEVILPSTITESEQSPKEPTDMELPSLEVRSLEDIESALKQIHEGAEVEEVILPSTITDSEQSPKEPTDMELPSLEVRSIEDIKSALTQIHEGSEVEEVILPSTVCDQLAAEKSMEVKSELQEVDARSLDDIGIALKHVSEGNVTEETQIKSELPLVEARTLEDIDTIFKHDISMEVEDNKPVVEVNSDLQSDVRFSEDIGSAEEKVSIDNELPKLSDSKDTSIEVEDTKESEATHGEPKLKFEENIENASSSVSDRKSES